MCENYIVAIHDTAIQVSKSQKKEVHFSSQIDVLIQTSAVFSPTLSADFFSMYAYLIKMLYFMMMGDLWKLHQEGCMAEANKPADLAILL